MCDSSVTELRKKYQQKDDLERQINQARKKYRVDDGLLGERDSDSARLSESLQHLSAIRFRSSPLKHELRVFLEEDQRNSDTYISLGNEGASASGDATNESSKVINFSRSSMYTEERTGDTERGRNSVREKLEELAIKERRRKKNWYTHEVLGNWYTNEVIFANTRNAIREFLEIHRDVRVRDIQRTHLGQALVRFESVYDRDHLVNLSSHQFSDVQITLLRHDQGRNFRTLNFNRECWLMLLGFPLDYRAQGHVESAIAPFGRNTFWEDDRANLSRILVRARVTDLVDVPQFVVLTDGERFQGFSWTIQVEVIQKELMGVLPQDEDPVPLGNNVNGLVPYDFFGFGQQVNWHHLRVAPHNEHMPFNPIPEPELALQIQPEPVEEPAEAWDLNIPILATEPMEAEGAQADFPQHQGEIDLNVEPQDEPMEHKEPQFFVEDNDSDSDEDAKGDELMSSDDSSTQHGAEERDQAGTGQDLNNRPAEADSEQKGLK
ncbi:hypothetical protein PR202_ga23274 [Eleusine coracana subsp. coracana]|uniref:DUF7597 domain-containing protein n=1 Tax=Eleusine coracana subsp. coracana TaxID=191504 RepID=A0AAV5D4T3_ELECO|nr:hypothetical protein PR202_ga23274 [Eleusine coracana subsp. coracana]